MHLTEQPLTLTSDELAAARRAGARSARPGARAALVDEIGKNRMRLDAAGFAYLTHADEMVMREAALCVRLDGRELSDVAGDAGAQLQETSVLLDDAERLLRTWLLAAHPGDLVGPLATGDDHRLVRRRRRMPPSLDDPGCAARAEDTIIAPCPGGRGQPSRELA